MEVKPGYKQTEVGVIPEEWEVKTLGSLTALLTNGFVGTATTAYVAGDDGVLYIQGYNVQENGFNFHGIKRVSKDFHSRNKKSCLQTGDLLTIQTGDIGVTTVVPPELAGANCHALIISRLRKQESEPGYYCQYFNSERGRVAFKEIETGTTMKHLNGGDMKRLFLPSPPVEQQRAIATALSDVDGLLGGLDRLIAKKRDLKQAAMQQLLTGQTRLPGFSGEWQVGRVRSMIQSMKSGLSRRLEAQDIGIPVLTSANIQNNRLVADELKYWYLDDPQGANVGDYVLNDGDILLCFINSLAQIGKPCIFRDLGRPVIYTTNIFRIVASKECDSEFTFYLLSSTSFQEALQLVAKPAVNQASFTKPDFFQISVAVPPLAEQTAIAEVLTEMDGELASLTQRREKTRALKQAMMQELLTGRIRLV